MFKNKNGLRGQRNEKHGGVVQQNLKVSTDEVEKLRIKTKKLRKVSKLLKNLKIDF